MDFDIAISGAARAGVIAVDPDEIDILEDLIDPPRKLWGRPGAIGFGVVDAVQFASPYALAMAYWYGKIWRDEAGSAIDKRTRKWIKSKIEKKKDQQQDVPPTPECPKTLPMAPHHVAEHIATATKWAVAMGLDEGRSEVLANAVVRSVVEAFGGSDGPRA